MRRVLFLAAMVCLAVLTAKAQDPVKVDPKHYKVEFENDQVRVIRSHYGPHEKGAMHEHPANVSVLLTDSDAKLTMPDGKTEEFHGKAGQTEWLAGVKHQGENLSDKLFELIQVELKSKPAATQPAEVQSALDPAKVDPKHCKVEFENDQVRVLRWNVGAHEKIPMHEHPPHVTVYLTDAHLRTTLADGKTAEVHAKAGQTDWGTATKHAAESIGDKPNELIQIELKAKQAPAKNQSPQPLTGGSR